MLDDCLLFYAQTDPYAEFSNFAPYGVEREGLWWRTVEHYFQAMKFHDLAYRERIRHCGKPKQAKATGMTRDVPLRADWDVVKDRIMLGAVRVKFATHAAPRALLLGTGYKRSWKTPRWMPTGAVGRMGRV